MRDLKAQTAILLANTLYQNCREGASLNYDFDSPIEGYMVSIKEGPSFPNIMDVNTLDVAAFIRNQKKLYSFQYFGVWVDDKTGKVYFDLSENFMDPKTAKEFAADNDQIAIWDVANAKEIRLKEEPKKFTVSWVETEAYENWTEVTASSEEEAIRIAKERAGTIELVGSNYLHSVSREDFQIGIRTK